MQNWFQAPASLLHHQVKNSGLYPLCPDLGSRRTVEGGEGQRGKRKDRMHKGLFCCCSLEQAKSKGEGSTQCLGSGSGTMSHRFPPAFSCLGEKTPQHPRGAGVSNNPPHGDLSGATSEYISRARLSSGKCPLRSPLLPPHLSHNNT